MNRNRSKRATTGFIGFWLIIPCLVGLIACSSTVSGNNMNNSPYQVLMENISYVPDSLSVPKGTKVSWINKDQVDHTVTSGTPGKPNGIFDSGNISPGKTWSYTFNTVGTFRYYCKIHLDNMKGVVTVH